ncbi:hypothetical protein pb186bvf_008366 [Paramecium bursaria]
MLSESNSESDSQQKMFNLDDISEDEDNQEAIQYLRNVRQDLLNRPKYTNFDDSTFQHKQTDKKYLIESKLQNLQKQSLKINPQWQQICVDQYYNLKQNIDKFREWKQSVDDQTYQQSLQNYDKEVEDLNIIALNKRDKFLQIIQTTQPTLNIMVNVDYCKSIQLISWIKHSMNCYNKFLWIFTLLTQLEDPLEADVLGNLNDIAIQCYKQDEPYASCCDFHYINCIQVKLLMLRFISRKFFSKEVLDYSKSKSYQGPPPTNCLVLHPIFHPNKGPEMELYLAEEAVGLVKALFWTINKGPFWQEEYTKAIRKSQGRPEESDDDKKEQQILKQIEKETQQGRRGQNTPQLKTEMKDEGWTPLSETKVKDGEYIHIPYFSGIYQSGDLLLDLSSESDDTIAHEWRNKIIRESIAKSSLIKVKRIHSCNIFIKRKSLNFGRIHQRKQDKCSPLKQETWRKCGPNTLKDRFLTFIVNKNDPANSDIDTDAESEVEEPDSLIDILSFLQIFAKRSTQGVARLQIELSFLNFAKTKLVRSGTGDLMTAKEINLEVVSAKQRRAIGKTMGSGESVLEIQRRLINEKISKVKKQLDIELQQKVKLKRKTNVINNIPTIALIGYTNAGKSAILNCILQKDTVESRDLLFQTLSTTAKKIKLTSGQKAIMLDTIGFITDLPHDLVSSFKSTLEEVSNADLVLHIRDISHPCADQQKAVVLDVLKNLGFGQEFYTKRMIEVWNKIDLIKKQFNYDELLNSDYPIVPVSAKFGTNVKNLLQAIEDKSNALMNKKYYKFNYLLQDHPEILRWLYDNGNITSIKNEMQIENNVEFECLLDEATYNRYKATFHPQERVKKQKGMPPPDW